MAYARHGIHLINYQPYRLAGSKLLLRGPKCSLDQPYLAFLGGAETYGRFQERPFPNLVGRSLQLPVLNLGCINAGPDVYHNNPAILTAARNAIATVVEIPGVQNQSNRFYSVHPLRNDRFIKPSRELMLLYPEVDFTEINFTRHLLRVLYSVSRRRFERVRCELQIAWAQRMADLIYMVGPGCQLFWFSDRPPMRKFNSSAFAGDPMFVSELMMQELRIFHAPIVTFVPEQQMIKRGRSGLMYTGLDRAAAETLLGAEAHATAAQLLACHLKARIPNLQLNR